LPIKLDVGLCSLIEGWASVAYALASRFRWDNEGDFTKAMDAGLKAWIEKYGNGARQTTAEGVEAK
jgi:hypothetical protein